HNEPLRYAVLDVFPVATCCAELAAGNTGRARSRLSSASTDVRGVPADPQANSAQQGADHLPRPFDVDLASSPRRMRSCEPFAGGPAGTQRRSRFHDYECTIS